MATGVLTITFRPPFTEFGFTVFAVSVGNTVVQPTNVQPATVQANTNSDSVGDINPGVVQTLNFISTTQLTLTVSGAQDSQQKEQYVLPVECHKEQIRFRLAGCTHCSASEQ